jgi:molecular chaperone DnaK
MAELAVGIDLGTSNSCVAVVRDGEVEVLRNGYGEPTTASVVAFSEDGMIEVGNHAKANIIHDPANTICSAKRLIGRYFFSEAVKKAQAVCAYEIVEGPNHGVRVIARDEEFSLPEISAMVLREMKQVADSALGQEVSKAVITVPAYFNDNQRQATKDAGRIAGLEVLRILNEPTAAALAYGFGRGLNQRVAVYDLGGGTFDVSVLEIGKDIFEVLSTCGDTFLGGDDFDDRLIDLLADEVVATTNINPRNDPFALEKIKAAAESAKKALSQETEVAIRIPDLMETAAGEPYTLERTVTQEEYGTLVMDLVTRTFKVCDEALQQADLTHSDLDGVILVGGPTRLAVIRESVAGYFQRELKDEVDPDAVVAKGAAIHAASLVGDASGASHDAFLLDVTPLDLRIGVAGGLAEPVIERNTPVPIEQTRRFTTTRDNQESVQIKVYQGCDRQADANELLGQFDFTGFRKAPRGDVAIDVTFEINADGIVDVTAFDPETEQRASTTLTLSSGLSGSEIDQIIEQDKTSRVKTDAPQEATSAAPEPLAAPSPPEPVVPEPVVPDPVVPAPEPVVPESPQAEDSAPAPDLESGEELELEPWPENGELELEVDESAAAASLAPAAAVPAREPEPEETLSAGASELDVEIGETPAPPAAELEVAVAAAPPLRAPAAADDELDLEFPAEDELAIDDEALLELADELVDDGIEAADTEIHLETEPEATDELFEKNHVDLSAGIEEE